MQITVIRKDDESVVARFFEDAGEIKGIVDDKYEAIIEEDSN